MADLVCPLFPVDSDGIGKISRKHRQQGKEFFPIASFQKLRALRHLVASLDFYSQRNKETHMSWKTPRVIEVAVGMEINCYACADI
jgi:coenzyme PQQ precursor peptide PqqA